MAIEKTSQTAFDPTGYDGRGRSFSIWKLTPSNDGMLPITESQWSMLKPEDRATIGGGSSKSMGDEYFFGKPNKDSFNDIKSLLEGLGL